MKSVEGGKIAVSAAVDISGMPETKQREMVAAMLRGSTDAQAPAKKSGTKKKGKSRNKQNKPAAENAPLADVRLKAELAEAKPRLRHVEDELESARATAARRPASESPSTAQANDGGIPPFLDRRPLPPDDQRAFDAIKDGLANSPAFRAPWAKASVLVRHLCVPKTLSVLISRRNRLTSVNHVRIVLLRAGRFGLAIQVEEPA